MSDQHEKLMSSNYALQEPSASSRLLNKKSNSDQDFFVDVTWLKELMDRKENFVLVDVTRGQGNYKLDVVRLEEDYIEGHIPGAIHFSTDELGEFKDYLNDSDELFETFSSKGIHKDSLVVFYSSYARDIMYIASRVAFSAYYLGLKQVKILDGGLQAWTRAGFPLESGVNKPQAIESFGASQPLRSEVYIKTPADLKAYLESHPDAVLASVRSWNEFTAQNEGHAWNKGVGEIAGAVFLGDDLLTNEIGLMSHPDEYLSSFKSWGIEPDSDLVIYCGTSWRASTAFFLLKQLGWKQVKLFDGSWYKWYQAFEKDPQNYPIQRGNPKDKEHFEIIDTIN